MKLFDLFGKKAKTPEPEKKKEAGAGEELELYSGMRVEVTTGSGVLLFVAKMLGIHGTAATLHQYSDTELPQDGEPIPVKIRGYSDRDRKAVYLEGVISPLPNKVWQVEELTLIKIENARAFFRLDTNLDATATVFGGLSAGERPCKLLNISVGGAGIGSEYQYQMGDKFLLKVKLLEDRPVSAMYCQVLRVIEKENAPFEYGCQFLELTEEDQEKITQNIFAAQRKKRGGL